LKNKFRGIITVVFPDGYTEKCLVTQRSKKGGALFLGTVVDYAEIMLSSIPKDLKGKVVFKYSGDFCEVIHRTLREQFGKKYEQQIQLRSA